MEKIKDFSLERLEKEKKDSSKNLENVNEEKKKRSAEELKTLKKSLVKAIKEKKETETETSRNSGLSEELEEEEQNIRELAAVYLDQVKSLLLLSEEFKDKVSDMIEEKEELIYKYGDSYYIEEQQRLLQEARAFLDSVEFKINDLVVSKIGEIFERLNAFVEKCIEEK